MMLTKNIRIPREIKDFLEEMSKKRHTTESRIYREALCIGIKTMFKEELEITREIKGRRNENPDKNNELG